MQINTQLFKEAVLNNWKNDIGFHQKTFYTYMKQTGDEYHWTQQSNLQQSSLTFNLKPSSAIAQASVIVFPGESEQQPLASGFPLPNGHFSDSSGETMMEAALFKYSFPDFIGILRQTDVHLKPTINSEVVYKVHDLKHGLLKLSVFMSLAQCPITQQSKKNKTFPTAAYFPKYHLFIKDNQAELSLNTNSINLKDQHALIRFIKQLIYNQGIYLQTFILNGVSN